MGNGQPVGGWAGLRCPTLKGHTCDRRATATRLFVIGPHQLRHDGNNNNKLVLILTRHTLARAGLANRLLDRHEVVTDNGDVDTLGQATP